MSEPPPCSAVGVSFPKVSFLGGGMGEPFSVKEERKRNNNDMKTVELERTFKTRKPLTSQVKTWESWEGSPQNGGAVVFWLPTCHPFHQLMKFFKDWGGKDCSLQRVSRPHKICSGSSRLWMHTQCCCYFCCCGAIAVFSKLLFQIVYLWGALCPGWCLCGLGETLEPAESVL